MHRFIIGYEYFIVQLVNQIKTSTKSSNINTNKAFTLAAEIEPKF